jgi:hypothetical protein
MRRGHRTSVFIKMPCANLGRERPGIVDDCDVRPREFHLNVHVEPALIVRVSPDKERLFADLNASAEFVERNGAQRFGREPEQYRRGSPPAPKLLTRFAPAPRWGRPSESYGGAG